MCDTLALSPKHTAEERRLIQCLTTYIVAKPAFDDKRLFEELSAILRTDDLLQKDELADFCKLKPGIALYAVAAMHNCVIKAEDGVEAVLSAHVPNENICVAAASEVWSPANGRMVTMAEDIFVTSLDAKTYCESDLITQPNPWDCALEVTSKMTLTALT